MQNILVILVINFFMVMDYLYMIILRVDFIKEIFKTIVNMEMGYNLFEETFILENL